MPCYKPMTAFAPLDGGAIVFSEKKNCREVQLPCGQCIGCRLDMVEAWTFRCTAEASLHKQNWFITLTYDDEHLPADESLNHRDWQLFAHRLRKRIGSFRFFMCGEYGENTKRAHYHALLFGADMPDMRKVNSVYSPYDSFESKLLTECWGKGFTLAGRVCAESARYCSSYVVKRCSEELAVERYAWVTRYGELVQRKQPYGKMSLKPGIGFGWLQKHWKDVLNHGKVFEHQFNKRIPPYFTHIMDRIDPIAAEELQQLVIANGLKNRNLANSTRYRLEVREQCAQARARFKKERQSNAV